MGHWVGDRWEWVFRWKRELSMGERILVDELLLEVDGKVSLNSSNTWYWNFDSTGVYSVKSAHGQLSHALSDVISLN